MQRSRVPDVEAHAGERVNHRVGDDDAVDIEFLFRPLYVSEHAAAAPTPEPASLVIFGAGLLAMNLRKRLRRSNL